MWLRYRRPATTPTRASRIGDEHHHMLARCPECNTVFRVTDDQLKMAGGRVRCGECATVFDASAALLAEPGANAKHGPGSKAGTATSTADRYRTDYSELLANAPASDVQNDRAARRNEAENAGSAGPSPAYDERRSDPVAGADSPAVGAAAPSADVRAAENTPADEVPEILQADLYALGRRGGGKRVLAWAAIIIVLSLLLLFQYAYFMRADLARHAALRPWLERMCAVANCTVPTPRDLAHIRLLSNSVTIDPQHNDRLIIRATMVNDAGFPQPYPVLEIKFTDLNGAVLAMRRFQPAQYLAAETAAHVEMPPRTPVNIELRAVKPNGEVTSYQFDFL